MTIREEKRDLFTVGEDYYLAHCISADLGMSAGIAVQFNRHFDMKNKLRALYPQGVCDYNGWCNTTIKVDRVFNLITKERYWHKPTIYTLEASLVNMRMQLLEDKSTEDCIKLAIPLIGCDLDKLLWSQVKPLITEVFNDMNIDILVCYIKEDLITK